MVLTVWHIAPALNDVHWLPVQYIDSHSKLLYYCDINCMFVSLSRTRTRSTDRAFSTSPSANEMCVKTAINARLKVDLALSFDFLNAPIGVQIRELYEDTI